MKHAVFQLLEIEGMITIEFKVDDGKGYPIYVTKAIKSLADYEMFKQHLAGRLDSLDDHVKEILKKQKNEKKGNNTNDLQPVKHYYKAV